MYTFIFSLHCMEYMEIQLQTAYFNILHEFSIFHVASLSFIYNSYIATNFFLQN